jgi:Purple acid Phosphatase, N-terminal domain/Calcineurin-like phosphoesterase
MIAAGTGVIAATATGPVRGGARGRPEAGDGTPEQVHLTWADDPTRTVVVSWASPGQADRPRVRIGQRVIAAAERAHTDELTGAVTWTYHARVDGLRPGATYGYAVTADNDANRADPFSATFTTAPEGRAAFRFTSFGDLTVPDPGAVETFQPLFHLLNGDLAYAALPPAVVARVWRDFGNNVQVSAASRPWMPVPGSHRPELGSADEALASYLTRYTLPSNEVDGFAGRWYSFRVGTALFVCLSGDDAADRDADALAGYYGADALAGPAPLLPDPPPGGGSRSSARGYSGGAQTRWLESTLAAARGDASIDWIVVQVHQCACSSAPGGNGSDLGVRLEWLPLFDTYEVDLVLSGHDHRYERSFPVRGFDTWAGTDAVTGAVADTRRPHPVTTVDSGVFDTSQGTVHLVLGSGGGPADAATAAAGAPGPGGAPVARVIGRPAAPVPDPRAPGGGPQPGADAVEAATWSARRATAAGYGIAVFDVNPGSEAGGQTSITVWYYHAARPDPLGPAPGAADDYALFETFTLVRPRSDGRRWHPKWQ